MNITADVLIKSMYEAIDRRDIAAAMEFIDEECVYQDLNFPQPFQGKEAIQRLFEKSCQSIPQDLLFVIDDITTEDPLAAGVVWHVELDGIPLPNGRGVSFYRLSPKTGKLVFARDIVEPPIKPGDVSFFIIRLISPLVRRLLKPQQENKKQGQPLLSLFFWVLAAAYIYILLLSPPDQIVPGNPAWAIQPETLQEVFNESINFFFVLPILNALGIEYMKAPIVHPVSEAFFNFAIAWIFMFLPLMLADRRGDNLPKIPLWGMAMFLTNAFLTPYMALRAAKPLPEENKESQKGSIARVFGWIGLVVGTTALAWFFVSRPEFGGFSERWQYFVEQLTSDRVALAFGVDSILFCVFQGILLGSVEPVGSKKRWLRFFPFWGLVAWLIL